MLLSWKACSSHESVTKVFFIHLKKIGEESFSKSYLGGRHIVLAEMGSWYNQENDKLSPYNIFLSGYPQRDEILGIRHRLQLKQYK